jgi:hypothetical protein
MISEDYSEFDTATYRVIQLLKKYPETRNSDKLLCELYYRYYENLEIPLSAVTTSYATLIRVRREIQTKNPVLGPTDEEVKQKREQKSKGFKEFFGGRHK